MTTVMKIVGTPLPDYNNSKRGPGEEVGPEINSYCIPMLI